jgi:hypothetical protein
LVVTISAGVSSGAPSNRLSSLQVTVPNNARVDVLDGPQDLAGHQVVPVRDGAGPVTFTVRRIGPGPITVPVVAVDACGEWPTLVGGGSGAF